MIETDASDYAIGAILNVKRNEEWKPIELYSKSLSQTQQNWPVRELEVFAPSSPHFISSTVSYVEDQLPFMRIMKV